MDKKTFQALAAAGSLQSVCLYLVDGGGFELWAFPHEGYKIDGNRFKTAKRQPRVFASLDTAFSFVRSMGYTGQIVIDDMTIGPPPEVIEWDFGLSPAA
jgi:hypothetical protein